MNIHEAFAEQIAKTEPLTQETIDSIIAGRKERNAPYQDIVDTFRPGDKQLYVIEQKPLTDEAGHPKLQMEIISVLESELVEFDKHNTYVRMGLATPIYTKNETKEE